MANLVELHYFNNHNTHFQHFQQPVQHPKNHLINPEFRFDDINNFFGDMDLFLLDLLLKESIEHGKILDIGFGTGRNLLHFLQRESFEVYGIETDQSCMNLIKLMISSFKHQDEARFHLSSVTTIPFPPNFFKTVVCARVFHLLNDQEKLEAWDAIVDVLAPGGLLYLTMNSMVNFEKQTTTNDVGRHSFPDGTSGYFLTQTELDRMIHDTRYEKVEPVRNLQYDDQHAETIIVLRKK